MYNNSTKDTQMTNKHIKICSTSLVIGDMQIKTIMKHYSTPTRLSELKKIDYTKCWPVYRTTESAIHDTGDIHGKITLENSFRDSYKVKHTFTT